MKRYSRKYIREAIDYWTRRLHESEDYLPSEGEPTDFRKVIDLGPDEDWCLCMGCVIIINKKTGEGRSLTDQECAKIKAYNERYDKRRAEKSKRS